MPCDSRTASTATCSRRGPACLQASLESVCESARERGLLERYGARWVPTALGRRFLNDLQAMFLPDRPAIAADRDPGKSLRTGCACELRQLRQAQKSVMGPPQLYTPAGADPKYATLRAVIQVSR